MKKSTKLASLLLSVGMMTGAAAVAAPAAQAYDVYYKSFPASDMWTAANDCRAWVNSHEIVVVSDCSTYSTGSGWFTELRYRLARHSGK